LEIESKFNTYKYVGLPPGPINNPGKDAIYAALYPEKNDFIYFVWLSIKVPIIFRPSRNCPSGQAKLKRINPLQFSE